MSEKISKSEREKIDLMQIVSLLLSIYVLSALIVQTVVPLSSRMENLLGKVDFLICIFFLFDFFLRFFQAESKRQFLKWGWIDLISSIPAPAFQWTRISRVVRIIRLLRAFRSTKVLIQYLFKRKSHGTLVTAALVSIVMMIFSSVAMLNVEKAPTSNINTPEDAIWWAFTTVTTVGYGDKYPVTTAGRLVAGLLMISSVGLFGIFTGFVASWFVSDDKKNDASAVQALTEEVSKLRQAIAELKTQSDATSVRKSGIGES